MSKPPTPASQVTPSPAPSAHNEDFENISSPSWPGTPVSVHLRPLDLHNVSALQVSFVLHDSVRLVGIDGYNTPQGGWLPSSLAATELLHTFYIYTLLWHGGLYRGSRGTMSRSQTPCDERGFNVVVCSRCVVKSCTRVQNYAAATGKSIVQRAMHYSPA